MRVGELVSNHNVSRVHLGISLLGGRSYVLQWAMSSGSAILFHDVLPVLQSDWIAVYAAKGTTQCIALDQTPLRASVRVWLRETSSNTRTHVHMRILIAHAQHVNDGHLMAILLYMYITIVKC